MPSGGTLADLCRTRAGLVAVDGTGHQVLLLREGPPVEVVQRLEVSPWPVAVACSGSGDLLAVASLWSRRITLIRLVGGEDRPMQHAGELDLPIAPRCLLFLRHTPHLLVADAFQGKLAVLEVDPLSLVTIRSFPAHNIRGLAQSPDGTKVIVAHQMLNDLAHTVQNDVHWGLLMSNDLRWLRVPSLLDPKADLYRGAHMHPLGEPGSGGADPSGLCVLHDGTVVATLGGVGQVAFGYEDDFSLYRVPCGIRPTAVIPVPGRRAAWIADTFADTLHLLDCQALEITASVSLGPQRELTLAELGERYFYDGRLSHDGWMSCHSCHTDGHTNGMLNDNLSDGTFGAPKRVLSLLGKGPTAPFAWNGSNPDLPSQIRSSIAKTMQGPEEPSEEVVQALAAFVQALPPPPPLSQARGEVPGERERRGQALFAELRCTTCHRPPYYTSPGRYDVGLHDQLGNRRFNPPSLRGVSQRGPYFHDGRAQSLEAVFRQFQHKLPRSLDDQELEDLVAFLKTL